MAITKLVIAFLLLVSSAFIGYSTYTGTQKKVTTSTQAANTWAQCDRGGSSTGNPTNTPCGSCSITDGSITINNGGAGTVQFGCELLCNTSGNPSDLSNCPTDSAASYSISSTSWFYCSGAGTQACTQGSPGLQSQGSMTQTGKPWTIAKQQTINDFQATFNIPDFEPCGRVQVDVQINAPGVSVAGDVFDTETDCTPPPTNTPTPSATVTVTPSPTPPSGGGTAQCPYTNIDTQFRKTGTTEWIDGDTLTSQITGVPVSIDINCFATNESGQRTTMNPSDILVNNTNLESNGGGQVTNYQVTSAATYNITCKYASEAVTNCQNSDSFVVSQGATATPAPTATPTITNTPTPSNSPTPTVTKTPTPTPSNTPSPTNTPAPTNTPTIVATAVPTAIPTAIPTATLIPPTIAPTEVPTIAPTAVLATATPSPTQAKLTVNNQPPGGMLPWLLLSIPTTLLLLGLLL